MKKRILTLMLALCLALSLWTPASAAPDGEDTAGTETVLPEEPVFEIDPVDAWKIWSQTDDRWGDMSISSKGYEKYNMRKEGCLITAMAKIFVYSGQQDPNEFTPADCLEGMLEYGMLTSSGALSSGIRMNTNGFLAEYAPELTYVPYSSHSEWKESVAAEKISGMIEDGCYVIIRAYNNTTGNYHFMAVDRVEDGKVYVMDNLEIIDLYASEKYGGIVQNLCFEYDGGYPYPAWESIRPETPAEDENGNTETLPGETPEDDAESEQSVYLKNFSTMREYTPGCFSDVPEGMWYTDSVANAYQLGLVEGVGGDKFGTGSAFTVGGAVTLAARIHAVYKYGAAEFEQGDIWYQVYVEYAIENGIIAEYDFDDYTRPATRGEMVRIFSAALPDEALPVVNDLPDGFIPDVSAEDDYAAAAYRLYRAGIVTGVDDAFSMNGEATISREEIATITARLVILPLRQAIELGEAA